MYCMTLMFCLPLSKLRVNPVSNVRPFLLSYMYLHKSKKEKCFENCITFRKNYVSTCRKH